MRYLSICYRNLTVLLVVFGIVMGCIGTPTGYKAIMEEGSQNTLPKAGEKVVVGGNHPEAVNQALRWLNGHQLLVVNRWVNQDLGVPEGSLRDRTVAQAQELAGAQKVGASLVFLVQVDESPLNSKNVFGVKIQGVNTETGEVVFGAKAWNPEPLIEPKRVIQDLTILALETIWHTSNITLSPQLEVVPEIKPEQKALRDIPGPGYPSYSPNVSHSDLLDAEESSADSQAQVPESTKQILKEESVLREEPVFDQTSPTPAKDPPMTTERSESSSRSSLGLHFASGALSIFYAPLKIVYAGLGGLVGGIAYGLTGGNEQVAQSIWDKSIYGTYWLTPDHLQGREPIRFKGEATH